MASLNKATGKYIIKRFPAKQWPDDNPPNWKRYSFDTLAEAEGYEEYALTIWRAGGKQPETAITTSAYGLGEVIRQFLRYSRITPKTLENYTTVGNGLIKQFGESTNINLITHQMLRDYFLSLDEAGKAEATVNYKLTVTKQIWKWAHEEELLEKIPVMPKYHRHKQTRIRFLTHDEEKALLDAMPDERWYYLTKFLLYTGLRVSEALAARPCDRSGDLLQVVGKGSKFRTVPLGDTALSCIDNNTPHREPYFPYVYDTYANAFQIARKAAGLDDVVIHTLRHTCFSRLAMKDLGVKKIQALAGHSSVVTTERYMHLAPSYLEEAARLIG